MKIPDVIKLPLFLILLVAWVYPAFAQGGIEHIKNQEYLQYKEGVDCSDPQSTLEDRICANLEYQRSDSALVVVYQELLKSYSGSKKMVTKIKSLQKKWGALRDKHCDIIWDRYSEGNGNFKYAVYLSCLSEMTWNRVKELKGLLDADD